MLTSLMSVPNEEKPESKPPQRRKRLSDCDSEVWDDSFQPSSTVPARRHVTRWTAEETRSLIFGLRKHGYNFGAIRNDSSLNLNPCRRASDIRVRFKVLHKNGQLPVDLPALEGKHVKGGESEAQEMASLVTDGGKVNSRIFDIKKGLHNEPVVRLWMNERATEWISTTHFPKPQVKKMMSDFIEQTSGMLKVALDLVESVKGRPDEHAEEQRKTPLKAIDSATNTTTSTPINPSHKMNDDATTQPAVNRIDKTGLSLKQDTPNFQTSKAQDENKDAANAAPNVSTNPMSTGDRESSVQLMAFKQLNLFERMIHERRCQIIKDLVK